MWPYLNTILKIARVANCRCTECIKMELPRQLFSVLVLTLLVFCMGKIGAEGKSGISEFF